MSLSGYVSCRKCGRSLHFCFAFPRATSYVPIVVHLSDGEHRIDAVFKEWSGDTIDMEMDLSSQSGLVQSGERKVEGA